VTAWSTIRLEFDNALIDHGGVMDRRAFVASALSALALNGLSLGTSSLQAQAAQEAENGRPGTPEQISAWMSGWMTRGYHGPLVLSRFADPIYILYAPIEWVRPKDNTDSNLASFTVPRGFVTDLASIPRVFWSVLRPDGNYAYAAILHDYLYWTQTRPRKVADDIIRRSMLDFHVDPKSVAVIYEGVRLGGQSSWDQNAKLRASGEKRFLRSFPDDPAITWAQWKANNKHFSA
jgi:hypothetical protein